MNKIILFLLFVAFFNIYSDEIDIQKIDFIGVNVTDNKDKIDFSESNTNFNICYSAILPAGGIYSLIDTITGKEAIVQIGFSLVNNSPYIVYLSNDLFNFFVSTYEKKVDKLKFKVKFIGWNKSENESNYLDLQNLVVEPEKSLEEIKKNGKEKVYIQLGSFTHHQNAFPGITEMLPYLEVKPNFYLLSKQLENSKKTFRVLAGPYDIKDTRRIVDILNKKKDKSTFIQTTNSILEEGNLKNEKR